MDDDFKKLKVPILERLGFAATYGITVAELFTFAQNLSKEGILEENAATSPTNTNASIDHDSQSQPQLSSVAVAEASDSLSKQTSSHDAPLSTSTYKTEEWRGKLWKYLTTLPDFIVGPEDEGKKLSIAEIEALPLPSFGESVLNEEVSNQESSALPTRSSRKKTEISDKASSNTIGDPIESSPKLLFQPRVFASHKRIWHTITGHTINWDRLPPKEFEALCAISAAGKNGIDQPTVTKLTGQDAKSLPKRTYALEAKGYIEKRPIIQSKQVTSQLTHKKFVDEAIANGTHYSQLISQPISTDLSLVPGSHLWTSTVIYEDALIRRMVDLVETWRVIVYEDAKTKMGVQGSRWHMRMFAARVRRFCALGVFEMTKAAMNGFEPRRSISFCRQPTEEEWKTEGERRSISEMAIQNDSSRPGEKTRKQPKKKPKRNARKSRSMIKTPDNPAGSEISEAESVDDLQFEGSEPQLEFEEDDSALDDSQLLDGSRKDETGGRIQLMNAEPQIEIRGDKSALDDSEHLNKSPKYTADVQNIGQQSTEDAITHANQGTNVSELSKFSEKLISANTASDAQHVTAENTSTERRVMDAISPSSDQNRRNSTSDMQVQKIPKRRGRPPGRKDSAPRAPKASARPKRVSKLHSASGVEEESETEVARFTSYDDLQREEGVPGVYINPTGSKYPTRRKNIFVAVFKTNLLKTWDPSLPTSINSASLNKEHPSTSAAIPQNSGRIPPSSIDSGSGEAPPSLRNDLFTPISLGVYQSPYTPSPTIVPPVAGNNSTALAVSSRTSNFHNTPASGIISVQQGATVEIVFPHSLPNQHMSLSPGPSNGISSVENSLKDASSVILPADAVFILTLWKNTPGKLCIAENKKSVIFFTAGTASAPPTPTLEIETSSITAFPIVSKTTSDSSEFRITGQDFEYTFLVSTSVEAMSAANILRAKIVIILIAQGFAQNEVSSAAPDDGGKPYQCDICLKRWRNDNGLLYHLTKSKTTCNPSWHPDEVIRTSKSASRPASRQASLNIDVADSPRNLGNSERTSMPSSVPENGSAEVILESLESTSVDDILSDVASQGLKRKARAISSEDSDFIPEEHTLKKRKVKTPNGKKRASILNSKTSTPQSKVVPDSNINMDLDTDSDGGSASPTPSISSPKGRKMTKKAKTAAFPNSLQYLKDIIMDMIVANGGIFPGGKSLWISVVGESQKKNPGIAYASSALCAGALKSLLNGRRLKRQTITFKTQVGLMEKYEVVTKTSDKPNPDALEQLKSQIRETWPDSYIPPPFKPSESLIEELKNMEQEQKKKTTVVKVLNNPYYLQRAATLIAQSAADEKDNLDNVLSYQNDIELEDISDSALAHADTQEQYMDLDQNGSFNPRESEPVRNESEDRPEDEPEEMTPEATFLQDPVTGLWDAPPAEASIAEKKKKPRKEYFRRIEFPEVITFMQSSDDSTWSFQPYGHGVRPIYARPGRRVEGNPLTDIRLRKLQDGHRPIIEPRRKMIAPARPSKLLTRALSATPPFQPFSDEEFARSYDATLPPSKRQKLRSMRNGKIRGKGRGGQGGGERRTKVHIPHQRPADMNSLPVIIPPNFDLSTDSIVFFPPNTNLGNGVDDGTSIFDYSVLSSSNVSRPSNKPIRLDWDAGEALTLFNPPWESENDYESEYERSMTARLRRPSGRRRINEPKPSLQLKNFKTRKLTHLLGDFESDDDMTGVPIASFADAPAGKRGKKVGMSPEMENRFVVAHIAIYIITGGISKVVDGVLVGRLFPKYTLKKVRELWVKIRRRRGKEIRIIEARFREAFLKGYEAGLFPALDYEDLLNYDWALVIDWYIAKYPVVSGGTTDGLPSSRSLLLDNYEIEDMQSTENWQDLFVSTSAGISKSKRHQLSCNDQLTISLHPTNSSTVSPDEAAIAKSVVRAAISTPISSYDQDLAKAKLSKIGETAVANAKAALIESKSINHKNKGRAIPSQPFQLTETYFKPLHRQAIKLSTFAEARKYKKELDAMIKRGQSIKIDRKQDDGAFLCIANLLAHDRIRLSQSNVPLSKFGLLQGSYETNYINKNQLLFVLEVVPTDSYIYTDQLNLSFEAPRGVGDSIPAWYDMNGNVLPDFWQKVQEAVFASLAVRPGATVQELGKTFYPALMEWELQLLMDWGTKTGTLMRVAGGYEGWTTGEWWWMIPGH